MKIITAGKLGAVLLALACSVIPEQASAGTPAGTAFTYQGELQKAGLGVTDACDFEFTLWEEDVIGLQIGVAEAASAVPVSDGLFTVKLDFGVGVFDGDARFLEIAVECPGDAGFTILSPRQELTPTPYAVHSVHAATADLAELALALDLPYQDSVSAASPAIDILNTGAGQAFYGEVSNLLSFASTYVGLNDGAGSVLNGRHTGTGPVVNALQEGTGAALDAEIDNPINVSDALSIDSNGLGTGVDITLSNAANISPSLEATTAGTGMVVSAAITNPLNVSQVILADHGGRGPGIESRLTNVANPAPALGGMTQGTGPAVVAHVNNVNSGAEAIFATTNGTGSVIYADHSGQFGPALIANVGNPANAAPTIRAVTAGLGNALEAQVFNPGSIKSVIFADTVGGGEVLTAVINNPANGSPVISAVGNHEHSAVYAELTRPDGGGNAVIGRTAGTEAAGWFINLNPGPGPDQAGVIGESEGFSAEAAGVMAVGNGAESPGEPRAAALRIDNGAVTVSGETRPAGTLYLDTSVWFAQESCESFCPDSCFHKHQVSQYAETTLFNDYLRGDSIIMLTVRTTGDVGDHRTYYAQVSAQTTGSAEIRVTGVGNDPGCLTPDPGEDIAVHYFIINPLDDV